MDVIQPIGIAITVAVALGGLSGLFAKGRCNAIIKAQSELINTRDKQITDKDKQIATLTGENKTLRAANETLTGLAQGSPELVKLTEAIATQTKAINKLLRKR